MIITILIIIIMIKIITIIMIMTVLTIVIVLLLSLLFSSFSVLFFSSISELILVEAEGKGQGHEFDNRNALLASTFLLSSFPLAPRLIFNF